MVNIKRQIVSKEIRDNRTSGTTSRILGICVHETANTSRGAGAQNHANLQSRGNPRAASWHYQVDDKEIIQSFEDNARCWHAGDGDRKGGMSHIAVEICVNSDSNYDKALKNAQDLISHLLDKHNLSVSQVRDHHYFSGKQCPRIMRERGMWPEFIKNIGKAETNPLEEIMSWYKNKEDFENSIVSRFLRYTNANVKGGRRQVYTHIRHGGDNEALIRAIGKMVGASEENIIAAINEANE